MFCEHSKQNVSKDENKKIIRKNKKRFIRAGSADEENMQKLQNDLK